MIELRRLRSDLLDRFGLTTDPNKANDVAWIAALAPGAVPDVESLVRLAELAVKPRPDIQRKANNLNTLGAAVYRAGRFEEAIRRLEEGIQLRNGISVPQDWVFLAMAHHRLGHRDQACRYLERLRGASRAQIQTSSGTKLEIRLLQNEAEGDDPL